MTFSAARLLRTGSTVQYSGTATAFYVSLCTMLPTEANQLQMEDTFIVPCFCPETLVGCLVKVPFNCMAVVSCGLRRFQPRKQLSSTTTRRSLWTLAGGLSLLYRRTLLGKSGWRLE